MGQTKDGWPARSWRDTGSAWLGLCPRGQHPRRPGRRSARAHSRSACADRARIPHLLPESSSAEAGKVEMGMAAEAWEDRCSAPLPFREDRDCVGFGARPAGVVQAFVVERQILESILVQRITRRKTRTSESAPAGIRPAGWHPESHRVRTAASQFLHPVGKPAPHGPVIALGNKSQDLGSGGATRGYLRAPSGDGVRFERDAAGNDTAKVELCHDSWCSQPHRAALNTPSV
jgi:hypothetical protein